jgi:dihydrodipicolinate synthase/N-acetylneuraminate lyase
VAVHTTQFEIRLPQYNLLEPVLRMAIEETRGSEMIMIAGAVGPREQALREAELAAKLGYQAVLLSLSALKNATLDEMAGHVRDVASVLPVVGFYLQPAVGGRLLPFEFWRKAADIENLIAIKMAPFNRYQTLDVIRAVAASDRSADIALYTGNDDNIIADLITPFSFHGKTLRIVGGLLGQWAVGTRRAVEILRRVHEGKTHPSLMLALNAQLTDLNGALFDVANGFHGCIAGIHEVLRRQGLMEGRWCLNPAEDLSPGQLEEIDRVLAAYPHLLD